VWYAPYWDSDCTLALTDWHWHLQNGVPTAAALAALPAVDCVPLHWILGKIGLSHVNFFVLDVEGTFFVNFSCCCCVFYKKR
jgi:hypothetical protein